LTHIGSKFASNRENFILRTRALIFLLFFYTICATAQQNPQYNHKYVFVSGKIIGRILDSATRQPIGFATVAIHRSDDKKIINGASANDKGVFSVDSVSNGTYTATFNFIGYKKSEKTNIVISDKIKRANLGDIILSGTDNELGTVNVTRQKSVIENKADMIVYNVEKDVTSQGGVATDVLKKIPQVSVDIDGNVEVQGNTNVQFLINGKPSTIFGNNLADVLQSIPASEIEKIEVITSPGAKYDAEGTGGIVNIVLKKSKIQGINGNITGSAGTRLENGSFNINGRKGNIGGHAWFSTNTALQSTTLSSLNSKTNNASGDTVNTLNQNGHSAFNRSGYQGGIGFDWDITPKNTISISGGFNGFSHDGNGSTNQQAIVQGPMGNIIQSMSTVLNSTNNFGSKGYDYSLFYKKLFDVDKEQLTFLYSSSNSADNSYYNQTQSLANNDTVLSGTRGENPGTAKENDFVLDYSLPVNKDITIDAGAKAALLDITSGSDIYLLNQHNDYIFNSAQSNALSYNRNVYAAYVSGNFVLSSTINAKAGLRYERTVTNANFGTGEPVSIPGYNTWAPSFAATKDIGNDQTIKLSYNYRIQRPNYNELNPFINAADPRNMSTGNPGLQPELSNKIETGYNKAFDKGSNLNISLFYQYTIHDIQSIVTYYPKLTIGDSTYNNVNLSKNENVGLDTRTGLNISGAVPFTPKLMVRGNISVYNRYVANNGTSTNGVDYRMNVNGSYQIDSNFVAEAFGNFNSPRTTIQGKMGSWSSYTIAIRKFIWHKQGSIGLTATDPFTQYVNLTSTLSGTNFSETSVRKVPYQSFGISFTYKFGKLEFKHDSGGENNDLENGD